mmetsp:Transcript_22562/g.63209  ORF Transcript_22562/g.63209 Transcript_22562/m.63209 type:complete len:200 (+) Transcript_22562:742-1341(+)
MGHTTRSSSWSFIALRASSTSSGFCCFASQNAVAGSISDSAAGSLREIPPSTLFPEEARQPKAKEMLASHSHFFGSKVSCTSWAGGCTGAGASRASGGSPPALPARATLWGLSAGPVPMSSHPLPWAPRGGATVASFSAAPRSSFLSPKLEEQVLVLDDGAVRGPTARLAMSLRIRGWVIEALPATLHGLHRPTSGTWR